MRTEIARGVEALGADDAVRAVIITGAGRAFCAGADVKYMTRLIETQALDEALALVEGGREVATAIRAMPKPVIAAINGPAAGGGANLALACDLRLASETATIGQTFNRIGLHPDWGGTYVVPRLVGPARGRGTLLLRGHGPGRRGRAHGPREPRRARRRTHAAGPRVGAPSGAKARPSPAAREGGDPALPRPPASRRCSTTRPPRSGPASRPTTPSKGFGRSSRNANPTSARNRRKDQRRDQLKDQLRPTDMSDGVVVRQAVIGDLEELVAMWTRYIRVHALQPRVPADPNRRAGDAPPHVSAAHRGGHERRVRAGGGRRRPRRHDRLLRRGERTPVPIPPATSAFRPRS